MLEINFHPFPVLITEQLVLRQITDDDLDQLLLLRSRKSVMEHIARPIAQVREDVKKLLETLNELLQTNNGISWALTLKDENKLFGTIGVWNFQKENFRAEIGYAMLPEYENNGYMNEAMIAVLKYGFDTLNLHSFEAHVSPANTKSMKLLTRNNFVREAYFKENICFEGTFLDTVVFSLVKTQ